MSYPVRKVIRSGTLFWFPFEGPDIERFFLRRLFRKLGIAYVPFTLRFYDRLFLREAKSKYNRALVDFCKKHHIETYIVQEGASLGAMGYGHIPMRADYFLCPEDKKKFWIKMGILEGQIMTYKHQKKEYKDILFMSPLYSFKRDYIHPSCWNEHNETVMKTIHKFLDEDVVFKLHRKNSDINRHFLPPHRVVEGEAIDLIKKYDKVYCFSTSSIVKDCELSGKTPILVDK